MKNEKTAAIFLFAIVLYSLAYLALVSELNFNWFKVDVRDEIKLIEYDKSALERLDFRVFSTSEKDCILTICEEQKNVRLGEGDNYFAEDVKNCQKPFVSLVCADASVHFSFNRTEENVSNHVRLESIVLQSEAGKIISVVNGFYSSSKSTYKIVDFYLDGKLVRSVQHLFEAGSNRLLLNESIQAYPGRHTVAVSLENSKLESSIYIPEDRPVDEYLILIIAFILTAILSRKNGINLFGSMLLFFTLLTFFLAFYFQVSKNLGYTYLTYPLILMFSLVLYSIEIKIPRIPIVKEALAFALIATVVCTVVRHFLGSAILTSHYYLRHLDLTYLHGNTNYFDELSYLGRPFAYPSQAFYMIVSSFSKILLTVPSLSIFNIHTLFTLLFAFTLYLTTSKLKSIERVLVSTIILSNYLVFTFLLCSPLHTFAFLLLAISVYFFVAGNKHLSALSLAVATSSHLTMILAFPFYAYAANGFKKNLKGIVICMLVGALLSSIFYLPLIARHGMLYQIMPSEKGYLQKYGILGSFIDFGFVFPLVLLTLLYGILDKKYRLSSAMLIATLVFYMFVSYRMNILSIFFAPFLLVYVFRKKIRFDYLMILPAASIFMVVLIYSGFTYRCELGAVNENCILPMKFIDTYTSSLDSVVTDPIYGHLEAYYGQRKVLADVFVEYANQEKYFAAKNFELTLDKTYLQPYNISIAMVDEEKKIEEFDKIYDNTLFKIYRLA